MVLDFLYKLSYGENSTRGKEVQSLVDIIVMKVWRGSKDIL